MYIIDVKINCDAVNHPSYQQVLEDQAEISVQ